MPETTNLFVNGGGLDVKRRGRRRVSFDTVQRELQFLDLCETDKKLLVIFNHRFSFDLTLPREI